MGYAAYGLEDRTPAQVAAVYDKHSRIEKSYEKSREARTVTTPPSTTIRLFYVGVGILLEQLWIVLQWAVLARPRRGGRALPVGFTFDDSFLHGIEQELDDDLGWKGRSGRTVLDCRQGASTDWAEPPRFGRSEAGEERQPSSTDTVVPDSPTRDP